MNRLRLAWTTLRSSLWFVPSVIVAGCSVLAMGLVELDGAIDPAFLDRFPRLFGAGAEGTRGMLSAIASATITVAGVLFSVTIVALSLTSTQYTSRALRNFMADRSNQVVLGAFVGIYAYCLVVLRTIRGGDTDPFVPSLAALGGIVLAFVGIVLLIHFIHHISTSIQASHILAAIHRDTCRVIDRLFPEPLGDEPTRTRSRRCRASHGRRRSWPPRPATFRTSTARRCSTSLASTIASSGFRTLSATS